MTSLQWLRPISRPSRVEAVLQESLGMRSESRVRARPCVLELSPLFGNSLVLFLVRKRSAVVELAWLPEVFQRLSMTQLFKRTIQKLRCTF